MDPNLQYLHMVTEMNLRILQNQAAFAVCLARIASGVGATNALDPLLQLSKENHNFVTDFMKQLDKLVAELSNVH